MIVKHMFVGWVGVVRDDLCANGNTEFVTNMFGTGQLKPHTMTPIEKRNLVNLMKENQPHLSSHIREVEHA